MNEAADKFDEAARAQSACAGLVGDADQHKGDHGSDDLQAHGVFVDGDELGDVEVLLDPAEEQFDLPAGFVAGGEANGGAADIVADDVEDISAVLIVRAGLCAGLGFIAGDIAPDGDAAQGHVELGLAVDVARDHAIGEHGEAVALCHVEWSVGKHLDGHVCFRSGDEESPTIIDLCPPVEVTIGFVKDIGDALCDGNRAGRNDVVDGGWCDLGVTRAVDLKIMQHMQLEAADATIRCGAFELVAQHDGGGINQLQHRPGFVPHPTAEPGDKALKDVRENANRAALVGISQRRTRKPPAVQMIVMIGLGIEARLQRPQTRRSRKLCINQSHQMLPAVEALAIGITPVLHHTGLEPSAINGFEKRSKDARSEAHARLPFCVSTTRQYQKKPDLTGMHPATHRIKNSFPRTLVRAGGKDGFEVR